MVYPPGDTTPDEFLAVPGGAVEGDAGMCVCEGVDPGTHGHGACHGVPLAHFEDHVGDACDDEGDFWFNVSDGVDGEGEFWEVGVDEGEDGLVGDAVAGVSG